MSSTVVVVEKTEVIVVSDPSTGGVRSVNGRKGNVDGLVEAADLEAGLEEFLNSASLDATTKANNAKSQALAGAATDASSKAATAKAEALSGAAADASSKSAAAKAEAIAAIPPFGATAGTATQGNDSRVVNALQPGAIGTTVAPFSEVARAIAAEGTKVNKSSIGADNADGVAGYQDTQTKLGNKADSVALSDYLPTASVGSVITKYGATSGSTDNTAAVQAAINATPTNGTVYIPFGNFTCTGELVVPSYLTFRFAGKGARFTYSGNNTFISLVNKREVKFIEGLFVATGTSGKLFSFANCFRNSIRGSYLQGQYVGPINSGSYLNQVAITLTANSGDNNFIDVDVTNFGIAYKTDCIQNYIIGGKVGTNNNHLYGFGGGGLSIEGTTFSAGINAGAALTDIAFNIDGATGQWWFTNVWLEGCTTALRLGSNTTGAVNGPSQFGMKNCKLAATTKLLDIRAARNANFDNIQLSGDSANSFTPTPVSIDAVNAPRGTMNVDTITGTIDIKALPQGWNACIGSGAANQMKISNELLVPNGSYVSFARSDNTYVQTFFMTGGPTFGIRGASSNSLAAIRMLDTGNNLIAEFDSVGSAVNFPILKPAIAGGAATFGARGTDTNIDMNLVPKGTGSVKTAADLEVTASGKGAILKSPNGTRYRITVSDAGVIAAAAV